MAACYKSEADSVRKGKLINKMAQNSVNLKYSLVITGMLRFKPASQSVERLSQRCKLCIEHEGAHFEQFFGNSVTKKEISSVF
jgi:ketopantoate reductase